MMLPRVTIVNIKRRRYI